MIPASGIVQAVLPRSTALLQIQSRVLSEPSVMARLTVN